VEQPVAQKVGGEFLVNTTTAGGQFQTSVTTLANGGFVIAWTDTSYSGGDFDGDSVQGAACLTPAATDRRRVPGQYRDICLAAAAQDDGAGQWRLRDCVGRQQRPWRR
jgi:hypothetical protein